jgi:formylglycine-generating enzyme required for sulfatase activity
MKRRVSLVLIGLLTLSLISCQLLSRCTDRAKGIAGDAATAVVATVASLPTATTAPPTPEKPPTEPDTSQPEPDEQDIVRPVDGQIMIPIPAGEFIMGADKAPALPNERPQRSVTLDAYYIDQTEITNAQYRLCVAAEVCSEPRSFASADYVAGYAGDDRPVVGVTWDQARVYCEWAEVRLPTEAEWEKAARGTDGRPYPWGSDRPDGSQANMSGEDDPYEQTSPVGAFPASASPYGVLDMTGNAREWVADWYQKDYYASAPSSNPPGPDSGELDMRVSRGGSFAEAAHHSRTSDRMPQKADLQPQAPPFMLGFRCATSILPTGETALDTVAPPTATTAAAAPTATTAAATAPTATTAAQPGGDGPSGPLAMEGLNSLDSYRAEWVARITYPGSDGGTMELSYKLEWTRDPPAQHVWMDLAMSPFAEVIWVGDETWVKSGDKWVMGEADEAEKTFKNFHDAFETDDEMTWVDTQMINGVRADHYLYDFASPNGQIKIHREIWVANEPGKPKVGVKATLRMENKSSQGTVVNETEANLTAINDPTIEIKRPK